MPLDGALLRRQLGHAAGQVAAELARSPTSQREVQRACRASSSSRPTSTISCVVVGQPGERVPKPACDRRDADGALGCGRRRTAGRCARRRAARRRARFCSTWRGVSGSTSTPSRHQLPRLRATIAWKFGGCGPSVASALRHERVLVVDLRASGCGPARSRAWRRSSCPSRVRRTSTRRDGRARPRSLVAAAPAAARAASGRCRARPRPSRSRGRAGRRRRRTASRRSAPPTARRRGRCRSARTRCARAGGRACASRGRAALPSSSSQPSSNGSWS